MSLISGGDAAKCLDPSTLTVVYKPSFNSPEFVDGGKNMACVQCWVLCPAGCRRPTSRTCNTPPYWYAACARAREAMAP